MDSGHITKGLKGMMGELAIKFLAYNLKRAINILGVRKLIEAMTLN